MLKLVLKFMCILMFFAFMCVVMIMVRGNSLIQKHLHSIQLQLLCLLGTTTHFIKVGDGWHEEWQLRRKRHTISILLQRLEVCHRFEVLRQRNKSRFLIICLLFWWRSWASKGSYVIIYHRRLNFEHSKFIVCKFWRWKPRLLYLLKLLKPSEILDSGISSTSQRNIMSYLLHQCILNMITTYLCLFFIYFAF